MTPLLPRICRILGNDFSRNLAGISWWFSMLFEWLVYVLGGEWDKLPAQGGLLGDTFVVKNKYEQKEDFYNMMRIEKLISYLILSFILLIAVFNIIGSLTMLIIDKTPDILTLKSLGANNTSIKRIFLFEGWLISILGAAAGMLLGVILVLLQQEFGLIRMQGSFIIQYYPVRLIFSDLIIVFGTVVILGFLAAYYPVKYIERNLLNKD